MNKNKQLTTEKKTIKAMIRIFCSAHHSGYKKSLCPDCIALLEYADLRIEKCPFGPDKGPCAKCKIHCYKPEMRAKTITVMRFAGPKMIYKHPVLAVKHLMKKFKKQD